MDSVFPENDSRPLPVSSSRGTDDDKHLSQAKSNRFIADDSLIIEEHPQYDLFKQ